MERKRKRKRMGLSRLKRERKISESFDSLNACLKKTKKIHLNWTIYFIWVGSPVFLTFYFFFFFFHFLKINIYKIILVFRKTIHELVNLNCAKALIAKIGFIDCSWGHTCGIPALPGGDRKHCYNLNHYCSFNGWWQCKNYSQNMHKNISFIFLF